MQQARIPNQIEDKHFQTTANNFVSISVIWIAFMNKMLKAVHVRPSF